MGVLGLTTFINSINNNNFRVFEDCKLYNCKLLVDGYGLLHRFKYIFNIDCEYGGNYCDFYFHLDRFFDLFTKCNVKLYFMFDGSRETVLNVDANIDAEDTDTFNLEVYLKKGLKRAKQRILNSFSLYQNKHLLPINAIYTLLELLEKHQILYYQCKTEADYELAYWANNLLRCPLLSNDSDFYIYNLQYGYIPIENLEIDLKEAKHENTSYKYLRCKLYTIEKFCSYFKFENKTVLPVFAVLCGNDYIDSAVFKSFLATFVNDNNNLSNNRKRGKEFKKLQKKLHNLNKNFAFYKKILQWLSRFESKEECMEVILRFIKKEQHEYINSVVERTIEGYFNFDKYPLDIGYIGELFGISKNSVVNETNHPVIKDYNIFELKYNKFEYSRLYIDLLKHKYVILPCQIENQDWPSSYISSCELRKYFYIKLFKKHLHSNELINVKEFLREKRNLKANNIEVNVNTVITDTESVNDEEVVLFERIFSYLGRENFIESIKQLSSFSNLDVKMMFLIINYWLNTGDGVNQYKNMNAIRSFVIAFMKYSIIDVYFNRLSENKCDENDDTLKFYETSQKCDSLNYDEIMKYLSENFIKNTAYLKSLHLKLNEFSIMHNSIVDYKYVHCLCEFQAIYFSLNLIYELEDDNRLLKLNKFFNASFLYSLKIELDRRKDPDLYIEELLGRKSIFKLIYKLLFDLFLKVFNLDVNKLNEVVKVEYNEKKDKNKKINNENEKKNLDSSSEDSSSQDAEEETNDNEFVDAHNRFMLLKLY